MPAIIDYDLPIDLESTGYKAFPSNLEEDDLVLFHVTALENYENILSEGFKNAFDLCGNGLKSVSFAKQSNMALGHMLTLQKKWRTI